jgi:RNA polymerase sigma factor (sigma-70 family)
MDEREIGNIISQAQQGSQRAFNALFDAHWDTVFRFLFQRTQNELLADELAMETFAKAFDNIQSYKSDFSFNTWLLTIAKNNQIDQIRKIKNYPLTPTEDLDGLSQKHENASPSPEEIFIQQQQSDKLLMRIKNLPETYRTILRLRYFDGLNYQQIEKKLNLTPSLVKVRLFRAKKMLAQAIANDSL